MGEQKGGVRKPWISTGKAARLADVTRCTMRRWCEQGFVEAKQIGVGRHWRVNPDSIVHRREWMRKHVIRRKPVKADHQSHDHA